MEKTEDEGKKQRLQWTLDSIKVKLEPQKVQEEIFRKYVGQYTRSIVTLEDGQLFFKSGPQKFKMIPLSETYFILDGWSDVRVEFVLDDKGKEYAIKARFTDGRSDILTKAKKKK